MNSPFGFGCCVIVNAPTLLAAAAAQKPNPVRNCDEAPQEGINDV